jgi:2-methylcitrate dehydratase PrpD
LPAYSIVVIPSAMAVAVRVKELAVEVVAGVVVVKLVAVAVGAEVGTRVVSGVRAFM